MNSPLFVTCNSDPKTMAAALLSTVNRPVTFTGVSNPVKFTSNVLNVSTGDATVRSCISMLPGKLRSVEAPIATAFHPGLFTKTWSPAIGSRPIDQNGSSQLPLVDFVQILIGCATDPVVATVRTTTRNHRLYTLTKPLV